MGTPTDQRTEVLRRAALTICGRREGKTESCPDCLRKAAAAVALAKGPGLNTALVPRIADIVCGSVNEQACSSCWDRATMLLLELRG
jgi:hypothetical protein